MNGRRHVPSGRDRARLVNARANAARVPKAQTELILGLLLVGALDRAGIYRTVPRFIRRDNHPAGDEHSDRVCYEFLHRRDLRSAVRNLHKAGVS